MGLKEAAYSRCDEDQRHARRHQAKRDVHRLDFIGQWYDIARDYVAEDHTQTWNTDEDEKQKENDEAFHNDHIAFVRLFLFPLDVRRATDVSKDADVDANDRAQRTPVDNQRGQEHRPDVRERDPAIVIERLILEIIEHDVRDDQSEGDKPLNDDVKKEHAERLQDLFPVEDDAK